MRAVDTNVLIRLAVRDDADQVRRAQAFVADGAWAPQLVVAETAWVLKGGYGRKPAEIADAIERLLDHETLTIQDAEAVGAALARYRARPALGFSDCLVLELARKAGHLPLGTFDRALAKLDGAQRL
jgi:predicted nucleic-acid-binding protein